MRNSKNSRAIRWLLNGLLLIFFIPVVIPASDAHGLVADRFFKILPVFLLLIVLRIISGRHGNQE